jgi:hypothetical protein
MLVGVVLGLLIGGLSGFFIWWLLDKMWEASLKQAPIVAGQLFAIPGFWFGTWLGAPLLKPVDHAEMLEPYILTVACIFVPVAAWRVLIRIRTVAKRKRTAEKKMANGGSDA